MLSVLLKTNVNFSDLAATYANGKRRRDDSSSKENTTALIKVFTLIFINVIIYERILKRLLVIFIKFQTCNNFAKLKYCHAFERTVFYFSISDSIK